MPYGGWQRSSAFSSPGSDTRSTGSTMKKVNWWRIAAIAFAVLWLMAQSKIVIMVGVR
jgi:hypothetical protein